MTTSQIPPISPNYGLGKVNNIGHGQEKGKGFQKAFEEDAAEEDQPESEPPSRILQPELRIRRRETEDGGHHIDVIA